MKIERHNTAGRGRPDGFTVVEILMGVSLLGLVLAASISALLFIMRNESRLAMQSQLNTEIQQVAALFRSTLRLSSTSEMVFWPTEGTPMAISFPVPIATDTVAGVVLGTDGRVEWGETLIIHAWPHDAPQELRLTRFQQRNGGLTTDQREQDLERVVLDGHGDNATGDGNPSTRTLARLDPEFTLRTEGKSHDFYAAATSRVPMTFGGVELQPGNNTLRFRVADKRSASHGYGLMIDQLRISPAGLPIEADALLGTATTTGGSATVLEDAMSSWSNRRWVRFASNAPGAELAFTVHNDTWHETLFRGGTFTNTTTYLSTEAGLVGQRLRPTGGGGERLWTSALQTRSSGYGATNNTFQGTAVRVVVRNAIAGEEDLVFGESSGIRVLFRATDSVDWGAGMRINAAFIAEATDAAWPSAEIATGTATRLQFGSPADPQDRVFIPAGETALTVPVPFAIDPDKSYAITYLIGDQGDPFIYDLHEPGSRVDAFVIPADSDPVASDLQSSWAGRDDLESWPAVVGVQEILSTHATNAFHVSRTIDTRLDQPELLDLTWTATQPDNTGVQMKVRSFDQPTGDDAPGWDTVVALSGPGAVPLSAGSGRYVQVKTRLQPDPVHDRAPELHDFTLRWLGEPARIDMGGIFGRFPGGGLVEVTVNDETPAVALRADMAVRGVPPRGSVLSWALGMEITPRN